MNIIYKTVKAVCTRAASQKDVQRIGIPSEAEAKACAKAKDDSVLENLSYRGALGYE